MTTEINKAFIKNLRPVKFLSHTTTIPTLTSSYIETLTAALIFPPISEYEVFVEKVILSPLSSVTFNVTQFGRVLRPVGGGSISISPGFYSAADINTLLGVNLIRGKMTVISTSGVNFTQCPELQKILGFSNAINLVDTIADLPYMLMNGWDVVNIQSNLSTQSDQSGPSFLATISVIGNDGTNSGLQPLFQDCKAPLISNSLSNISWNLYKSDGITPYPFQNPLIITTHFYCYKK
jgi:hypothetical protein